MTSSNFPAQIRSLDDLIRPVSVDDFLRHTYGSKPLHIPGSRTRFSHLLTWEALSRIVLLHRPQGPRVRFAKEGISIAEDEYSGRTCLEGESLCLLRLGKVKQLLREDSTLIVDAIDEAHDPIGDLCRMLEAELGSRFFVDAFASWQHKQGFNTHWDPEDVFVLQLAGVKRWRVLKPKRLHPTPQDKALAEPPPDHEPAWQGELNPGDLLYIPGGWWHDATPISGPTLHLSASTFPATGLSLANSLVKRLADNEFMRERVPRFASDTEQHAYMTGVRAAIAAEMESLTIEGFLHELDAHAPARLRLSLPWDAAGGPAVPAQGACLQWMPPRRVPISESDADVTIEAMGTRFTFPKSAKAPLLSLMEHRQISFREFCEHQSDTDSAELLIELIKLNLVAIIEPSST